MDQSELEDFTQALVNCQSNDDEIRNQSTEMIYSSRDQDLFGFLNALLCVIQTQQTNQSAIKMAFLLANRTIKEIDTQDPTIHKSQFIENNSPELLENYLSACTELFPTLPNLSAILFSTITLMMMEFNDNCEILPSLLQQFESISDSNFIYGAFFAIDFITTEYEYELTPEIYQPILNKIITVVGDQDNPLEVKSLALKILSNIVFMISNIFENEENLETITNVVKYAINEAETKASGYKCLAELIEYHFPAFEVLAEEAVPLSMEDLEQYSEKEPIILSIISMIDKLSVSKNDEFNPSRKEILTQTIPSYFDSLIKIAMNHSEDPNEQDLYNSSIASYELLDNIASCIPDVAMQIYSEFAQANIQSEDIFFKEMALMLCSYIVCKCESGELIPSFLEFFPEIFNEPEPRIRNAALLLLQNIIAHFYGDYNDQISSYSEPLLQMLSNESDSEIVARRICYTISMIKDLPNYKEVIVNMIQNENTKFPLFSYDLFDSIAKIFNELNDKKKMEEVIPDLVNIVKLSITDENYFHIQSDTIRMLSNIKYGEYLSPYLVELHPLLVQFYEQTQNTDTLICLSSLAKITDKDYSEYLPELIDLLLQLSERSDDNEHMFALSISLKNLQYLDLQDFAVPITEVILEIFQSRDRDLTISSIFLPVLRSFYKYYFNSLLKAGLVIPAVQHIRGIVSILDDIISDEEKIEFIDRSSEFMVQLIKSVNDPSTSFQWFDIGCGIFDAAAKSILLEDYQGDLRNFTDLFHNLFEINDEELAEFLSQSEDARDFIADLTQSDICDLDFKEDLRKMGVQLEEE